MRSFVARGARLEAAAPDNPGGSAEAKASGGMFTSLTLILLTLVVYLFSLSLPDEAKRRAIHASLAKAFLFDARHVDWEAVPEGPVRLLAPGRQALRELQAHLEAAPGGTGWEGDSLVVTVPADALFGPDGRTLADRAGTLPRVSRLVAATDGDVRVEAAADPEAEPGTDAGQARTATLAQAVAVTRDLLANAGGTPVDPGRLSAVGLGLGPGPVDPAAAPAPARVRVVFVDAKGAL